MLSKTNNILAFMSTDFAQYPSDEQNIPGQKRSDYPAWVLYQSIYTFYILEKDLFSSIHDICNSTHCHSQ